MFTGLVWFQDPSHPSNPINSEAPLFKDSPDQLLHLNFQEMFTAPDSVKAYLCGTHGLHQTPVFGKGAMNQVRLSFWRHQCSLINRPQLVAIALKRGQTCFCKSVNTVLFLKYLVQLNMLMLTFKYNALEL